MRSEKPDLRNYYLFKNSYTSGPFTIFDLERMINEKTITSDDLICPEGMNNWQKYADVFSINTDSLDTNTNAAHVLNEPPKINYLIRHWRGDLALSRTYWINVFLVTFAFKIISLIIIEPITKNSLGLITASLFSILCYVIVFAIAIWQVVGLWRSSSKHRLHGGSEIWSGIAKFIAICVAINTLSVVINNMIPASLECISILAGDNGIPSYKITVLPGGNDIEYRGGIRAGSANELKKILSSVPLAQVFHIESSGGRVNEAVEMAKLIKDRNMTTYTAENCQSAATLVLLAGKERVIAADAKVGFHSASFPGLTRKYQNELQETIRSIMKKGGVTDAFINRVVTTPSDDMWYPTFKEMCDARVVTSKTYGDRFASSQGVISDEDIKKIIQACEKYSYFQILQQEYPRETNKAVHDVLNALRSGKSEGESYYIFTQYFKKVFQECLPSASDEAILEVRDAMVHFMRQNMYKNTDACIAMLTGEKINYSRALKEYEMQTLTNAMLSVISSGHNKSKVAINTSMADQDMESITIYLANEFGEDVIMLSDKKHWKTNAIKACSMFLSCLERTKTLPLDHQPNFFRYLMVD